MDLMGLTKINNFIYFLFFLIALTSETIINNPKLIITSEDNPFIYNINEIMYMYYPQMKITRNITSKEIISSGTFCLYSAPYTFIIKDDEVAPSYIYYKSSDNLISVSLSDSNCITKNITSLEFPSSTSFIGSITESRFVSSEAYDIEDNDKITGVRCDAYDEEIIIYGKTDSFLVFTFIVKNETAKIVPTCNMEEDFKCIKIKNSVYLCAYICSDNLYIVVYAFQTIEENIYNKCEMKEIFNKKIDTMNIHTKIKMEDGFETNEKVVCAKNKMDKTIDCLNINYEFKENQFVQEIIEEDDVNKTIKINSFNFTITNENKISFRLPLEDNSNDHYVIKKSIEDEYLICCGGDDKIICGRMNKDYNFTDSFALDILGTNFYPNFVTYSENIYLIYMNYLDNNFKIYEHSIIMPSCIDEKTYSVIPLGSFSDEIKNLINKDINSNYYVKFITFPTDYGNLTVSNQEINENTTYKILVEDESIFFEFISLVEESVPKFEIKYLVYLEETFSTECSINLNILKCYHSCHTCSKSEDESSEDEHNCLSNSCKDGYFPDPDDDTKCWSMSERKSNWYIDLEQQKFFYCNDSCASCDGPSDTHCLSCKSNTTLKYLFNRKCFDKCPDGYFAQEIAGQGYYKCLACFETCKTCDSSGNKNYMNCKSCKENCISYTTFCFFENDPNDKSFLIPGDNTVSSCKERLGIYILADTYECINRIPSEGYYLDNERTGLYSRCHPDCKTCSGKMIEGNTKCILCNNEDLNFLQGNCLENCPIGYYSLAKSETNLQKKCMRCDSRCYSCTNGIEYTPINMNCLECAKGQDPNNSTILVEKHIKIDSNCFPFVIYSEEKIIFDIRVANINNEENTLKSCLDFGLSIFYGEYICITRPTNTYYVVNDEENTGIIKYCDTACSTCNGPLDDVTQDTNCIICSDGYFKTEDSETNCIIENLISNNYYKNLEDNIYYKCHQNCQTCERTLSHLADTSDMGCITCLNTYFLVDQTNNCFDNSFLDENIDYYFSSEDGKFHKCYDSCKRCSTGGTDENHNCDECKDNYYYEESTNNCFDMSYTNQGFYFDNFTNNLDLNELPVFKRCYSSCQTCTNQLIENDMNCITCISGYYRIIDTNNCITDLTNNGYYLKNNLAIHCEDNCLTCSDGKTPLEENNINNNNITITNITYNCLSCDQINKNLFLVENINNCEPIDFKVNGYYLQEEEDGTRIFHKCYQSCSLCEKYKEINPITNTYNHNCDQCAENYYPLLDDENPKNCYGEEEMVERGLRLVRNIWQICHENCGSCSGPPTYDGNNIISENCDSCYIGFKFIFQTLNCANETYLEKGYYFDDEADKYKPCDISCISCEKNSTSDNPKCLKCNEEKGFFNIEYQSTSLCYSEETKEGDYVLSTRYDENGKMYKIWGFCYKTCLRCLYHGNAEDNGCSSCISGHYLVYNSTNCFSNEYAINNGYYFNSTFKKYVKCDEACNNCQIDSISGKLQCKDCNFKKEYYPIEGKTNRMCYNNDTIPEGYFLNEFTEPFKWSECYINCARCLYTGNKINMNCISCRTNLINKVNKTTYFLLINGNCIEACPDSLFLTKDGDCVSICPEGTYHFQLDYNFSCVEFCPEKYVISSDGKKCELPEFQRYITSSEFKKTISEDITSYVNSSRIIDLDNIKAQIFYSDELNVASSSNSNKIALISNLENSLALLKIKNNIASNEKLIISLIETKEDKEENKNLNKDKDKISLGKDIEIIIYDSSGRILDLSNLENDKIIIKKNLDDLPYIDMYKAKYLYEKGIDIFDESDRFFNDICYPFKSNYSSDIILADRRATLFENVSFCDSGCSYEGVDYELMLVTCTCYLNSINNDNNEEKKGIVLNNNPNGFPKDLYKTNLILMKCSNLAFDSAIIKNNTGFYFTLIGFIFESTFFFVFIKNGLNPIKNFMIIFGPGIAHPPKLKNLVSLAKSKNENNKQEEIQKTILINNLLNKKRPKKNEKEETNEVDDDALVVKYSQSDYEGYESNRNSLNNNDKNKMKEEKKSISESDSESDKEKRTRLTRKKTNKRNNLVFPNKNQITDEKPKYDKNYIHPMDNLDNLSHNKKSGKFNSKKNNLKTEENIFSESNSEDDNKETIEPKYYKDTISKNKKHKKHHNKKEINEKKSYLSKKKKEKKENDGDEIEQKNIVPYRNKNYKMSTKIGGKPKQNKKNNNYTITSEELLMMNYEEAINNDKRIWSKIYWAYIIEKNFIINTFVSEAFLDLRPIKINFLFFRLEIIFVLNALFYSDSYISKTYYNKGNLDFLASLPKAFFSFLVCLLATIFLRLLLNNRKDIFKVIKEKDDNFEYKDMMNEVLKKSKIKLIIFFILELIFSFIFLYYVTAFCAVYQNSKINWVFGCFETIAIDIIFPFIYCLIISSFRYMGIRKKSKCLYETSNLFGILL